MGALLQGSIFVCVCVGRYSGASQTLGSTGGVHAKGICYRRVEDINLYV